MGTKKTNSTGNVATNAIKYDHRHCLDGFSADMTESQLLAVATTRSVSAAFTVKQYANVPETVEISDYMAELDKAGVDVAKGDLTRLEKMLTTQAISLDNIFNKLAVQAIKAEYVANLETYLKLALKAQSQCKCTVEALSMLKNPQPYIKQTNIGQLGNQQVNNTYATMQSHTLNNDSAEKIQPLPNKLLEDANANILDTRTQSQAISLDTPVAAMV